MMLLSIKKSKSFQAWLWQIHGVLGVNVEGHSPSSPQLLMKVAFLTSFWMVAGDFALLSCLAWSVLFLPPAQLYLSCICSLTHTWAQEISWFSGWGPRREPPRWIKRCYLLRQEELFFISSSPSSNPWRIVGSLKMSWRNELSSIV